MQPGTPLVRGERKHVVEPGKWWCFADPSLVVRGAC